MNVAWRRALPEDLPTIARMYEPAEEEQVNLREAWGIADGLAEPHLETLAGVLADEAEAFLAVGTIDDVIFGFAWAHLDDLLPQAKGERIGVIRMIYVDEEARAIGVGEAMLAGVMEWFATKNVQRFDAIVSPGHRLAKNFFESAGFKARRITMYRRDG